RLVVTSTLSPGESVGNVHGKSVVQSPELLLNEKPAGIGLVSCTFVAASGPLLLTVVVYENSLPGRAPRGCTLILVPRSALPPTGCRRGPPHHPRRRRT